MAAKKKSNKGGKKALVVLLVIVIILAAAAAVCWFVEPMRTPVRTYVSKVYVMVISTIDEVSAPDNGGGNTAEQGKVDPSSGSQGGTPNAQGGTNYEGGITTYVGAPVLSQGDVSIHFLELGNKYTGDSTFIKVGDVDILIDAGSKTDSSATIVPYLRQYCTDGVLEYVIATHAHEDHIAGFVGKAGNPGVFDSFDVGTVIEFSRHTKDTDIYLQYCSERDEAVARSSGAVCYDALQCWEQTDGAKRHYEIAEGVSMDILYNYYYDHDATTDNNYSVCTLLTVGDKNYLFTGDLEKQGEKYLVQYNTLPTVEIYKGGHHGSKTSSTEALMSVIQPKVVCVCCCVGSPEYTMVNDNIFPTQAFFDNVLPYTELIFATSLAQWDYQDKATWQTTASCNGNIVVVAQSMTIYCSASDTPLPQSTWFADHRQRKVATP